MKKLLILVFTFILALYGCTEESEKAKGQPTASDKVNEEILSTPKYENMRILEIENERIVIGPPATDPTASYPAYEIFIEENTKVEGSKTNINELSKGDHVNVWTKTGNSGNEIAEEIVVIN